MLKPKGAPYVSTQWLFDHLNLPQLVILDATLTDKNGSWSEWGNKKLQLPFCQQNHILCDASPK